MVTADWLSSAVENTCCALVGIVVFFWISLVITPPSVSMPSDSGVTSSSSTSLTSPFRTPPWIAAPTATTSSGFTLVCFLAEVLLHGLLDLRNPRRSTDEHHLVDVRRFQACISQCLLDRFHR